MPTMKSTRKKAPRKKPVPKGIAALRATRKPAAKPQYVVTAEGEAALALRFVLTVAGAARASGKSFDEVAAAAVALNLGAHENVQVQDTAADVGRHCIWQMSGRDSWKAVGKLAAQAKGAPPMVNKAAE